MRWSERQQKIEEYAEDYLDELSDELNISIPFYPQVWWIGRPVKFEDLGLTESYREDFDESRKYSTSKYLHRPKTIIIAGYKRSHIAEEISHFLHLNVSGIGLADNFGTSCLVEAVGFLGSKLVCSDRKNPFSAEEDVLALPKEQFREIKSDYPEYCIHQQGYCLGERIYYAYLEGNFSRKSLKDLFSAKLSPAEAKQLFYNLRKRFWPFAG